MSYRGAGLFRRRRGSLAVPASKIGVGVVFSLLVLASTARGQNPNGLIPSDQWLALGPFVQGATCGLDRDRRMRTTHVAPTEIQFSLPDEGDEIDYDPGPATTSDYLGPVGANGNPIWRLFDDGAASELLDFRFDAIQAGADDGGAEDLVTFVATYFEYLGDTPIEVELCSGTNAGIQVFLDNEIVLSEGECRRNETCADLAPMIVYPGLHRLLVGVWGPSGEFNATVGLRQNGEFITDRAADWLFLGTNGVGSVYAKPQFEVDVAEGRVPFEVQFDASGTVLPQENDLAEFVWLIGDTVTLRGRNVAHTFSAVGFHTVRLFVITGSGGISTVTREIFAQWARRPLGDWTADVVGFPEQSGSVSVEGDCFESTATGGGMIDPIDLCRGCQRRYGDEFVFINRPTSSPRSTFTARVTAAQLEPMEAKIIDTTHVGQEGGRIGVMARNSLSPTSVFAFMGIQRTTDDRLQAIFVFRWGNPFFPSVSQRSFGRVHQFFELPDVYVRLDRVDDLFTGYLSRDGIEWTEFAAAAIDLPSPDAPVLQGMVISAGDSDFSDLQGYTASGTVCDPVIVEHAEPLPFRRGDADADSRLLITDSVFLLNHLFLEGPQPTCDEAADADDDGRLLLTDAVFVLSHLFLQGDPPPAPGPVTCGLDPTGSSSISCERYDGCL